MSEKKQKSINETLELTRRSFTGEPQFNNFKISVQNSLVSVGLLDTPTYILCEDQSIVENQIRSKPSLYIIDEKGIVETAHLGEHTTSIVNTPAVTMYHLRGRLQSATTRQALKLLLTDNGKGVFAVSERGIAAYKKDCENNQRSFKLSKEKEKYEGDFSASILEIYEKENLIERCWIDSDRGYICPKAQTMSKSKGNILGETICENFVLDEHSQKWFPRKVTEKITAGEEFKSSTELQVKSLETFGINRPIPDSVFAIAVQKGGRIDDFRRDDNDKITFRANVPGTLDASTVEKGLDETEWLTPREVRQYYPPPIEKATWSWISMLFMAAGLIVIVAALVVRFCKK